MPRSFLFTPHITTPTPTIGQGQILLKVGGSSLNQCDSDTVQGYPGCHINEAGIPGGDVAGTVVALGPTTSSKRFEPYTERRRVAARGSHGFVGPPKSNDTSRAFSPPVLSRILSRIL